MAVAACTVTSQRVRDMSGGEREPARCVQHQVEGIFGSVSSIARTTSPGVSRRSRANRRRSALTNVDLYGIVAGPRQPMSAD
jgi:hypothetical protein